MNEELTELIEIVTLKNTDIANRRKAIALIKFYEGIYVGRLLKAAQFDDDKEWVNALWQESEAIKSQVDTCEPVFFIVQALETFNTHQLMTGKFVRIEEGSYFMACNASDKYYAIAILSVSDVWVAKERFVLVPYNTD